MARKSTLLLLLAMAVVFSEGCSKKIPCADTNKATAKTKKTKKQKAPKKQEVSEGDGTETAEASVAPADEESSAAAPSRPKITVRKNQYSKNGLLQKKKYKFLRSNPGRKRNRANNGIFSIFSGNKKSGSKSRKSKIKVEPAAE